MSFLVKDPCGYVCIFLTYAAVFYADYVVIRWVVLQTMQNSLWGSLHVVLFNTIIFFVSMAHLRAMCSDPGTVPLPQTRMDFSDIHSECSGGLSQSEDWTVCTRCETYRPPRAHHCRICKRCIRRMDHHCPWINNCVGEQNQKYFLQFLMYVGVLVTYAMVLVVMSLVRECPGCEDDLSLKQSRMTCHPGQIRRVTSTRLYRTGDFNAWEPGYNEEHEFKITLGRLHCVLLMVESLLFGMFVAAMLVDQLSAILGDETAVEQASQQGPYRPHKPRLALLTEVCGPTHPLLWLLPCDISDTKPYHSDTQSLITHDV